MTAGSPLTFAGTICCPAALILAIFGAVVLAVLGVRALRPHMRRAMAWVARAWFVWGVDREWRRAEREQERALLVRTPASRERHTRLIAVAMRSALLTPPAFGDDARMTLLATGWAIGEARRGE